MFSVPGRRVRYTSDVKDRIYKGIEIHERLGDVVLALEDLLRHDPRPSASELVREPNGTEVRVIRVEKEYGAPEVTLVYEIESDDVVVFGVRIA